MLDDKIEQGSSIIPFGLLSLSIATFLTGFTAIFESRTAMAPCFTMALLFGGVGEFLAGMWAFAYRESFVATIFSVSVDGVLPSIIWAKTDSIVPLDVISLAGCQLLHQSCYCWHSGRNLRDPFFDNCGYGFLHRSASASGFERSSDGRRISAEGA